MEYVVMVSVLYVSHTTELNGLSTPAIKWFVSSWLPIVSQCLTENVDTVPWRVSPSPAHGIWKFHIFIQRYIRKFHALITWVFRGLSPTCPSYFSENEAIWDDFSMIPVRSQWGHYNLPRRFLLKEHLVKTMIPMNSISNFREATKNT